MYSQVIAGKKMEEAYDKLKFLIRSGVFKPGQKLSVQNLSQELKIGITPLREALLRLSSESLINYISGYGFQIKIFQYSELVDLYKYSIALISISITFENNFYDFNSNCDNQVYVNCTEISVLCDYIERIYMRIASSSENINIINSVSNFIDRSHNYRITDLAFLSDRNKLDCIIRLLPENNESAASYLDVALSLLDCEFSNISQIVDMSNIELKRKNYCKYTHVND